MKKALVKRGKFQTDPLPTVSRRLAPMARRASFAMAVLALCRASQFPQLHCRWLWARRRARRARRSQCGAQASVSTGSAASLAASGGSHSHGPRRGRAGARLGGAAASPCRRGRFARPRAALRSRRGRRDQGECGAAARSRMQPDRRDIAARRLATKIYSLGVTDAPTPLYSGNKRGGKPWFYWDTPEAMNSGRCTTV